MLQRLRNSRDRHGKMHDRADLPSRSEAIRRLVRQALKLK
jgi:hypothetical protein